MTTTPHRATALMALALTALFWTGCLGCEEDLDAPEQVSDDDSEEEGDSKQKVRKKGTVDKRIEVRFKKPRKKSQRAIARDYKSASIFKDMANDLNKKLILPHTIPVVFESCGEENAFYDPETRRVSMCYELLDSFERLFEDEYEGDEFDEAVMGAALHTFLHELGHALVDTLELPITGKEEDAVDQLATYILLGYGDEGELLAIGGAEAFLLEGEEEDLEDMAFWDEHSLGEQRFYNILCWIYGKSPEEYDGMVEEDILPEERAEGCPAEYDQLKSSWKRLLAPHTERK